MNMLRQEIKDKRLIDLIKKYLKSGDEERHGKVERVAAQKNTDVYPEAVEEAENKSGES